MLVIFFIVFFLNNIMAVKLLFFCVCRGLTVCVWDWWSLCQCQAGHVGHDSVTVSQREETEPGTWNWAIMSPMTHTCAAPACLDTPSVKKNRLSAERQNLLPRLISLKTKSDKRSGSGRPGHVENILSKTHKHLKHTGHFVVSAVFIVSPL